MKQATAILFILASAIGCGATTPDGSGGTGGVPCGPGGSGGSAGSDTGGSATTTTSTGEGYCACDCPVGPPPPLTVSEFCDSAPVGATCCLWHNSTTLLIGQCSADHVCYYTDF